jgi:hypothetical protein
MLAGDDRPLRADLGAFARLFRSRAELEAEILVLRHQLNVLRRKSPSRLAFSSIDRLVFAGMYALAPNILDALKIVKGAYVGLTTRRYASGEIDSGSYRTRER